MVLLFPIEAVLLPTCIPEKPGQPGQLSKLGIVPENSLQTDAYVRSV